MTPYFENVPSIGNLYHDYTLFEFENNRIVFVCTDEKKNYYFCVCTDALFHYCCLIRPISLKQIQQIIRNENSIDYVLKTYPNKIIIATYENSTYHYDEKYISQISKSELPRKDVYLDLTEEERRKTPYEAKNT